jgi:hypothetical protein
VKTSNLTRETSPPKEWGKLHQVYAELREWRLRLATILKEITQVVRVTSADMFAEIHNSTQRQANLPLLGYLWRE